MKKNFRIKAGLLALATAIFTLSVRDIKADYDYNTSDTTNYTSYYGLRNTPTTPQDSYSNDDSAYTYSRRNYRETPSYEDSYRSSNRDYYSSSPYRENYNSQELARYQQLEANRKALITEYKRLKTINEERQLTPESSQQLEKLKSEAADLGEQVNQATSQYTEDYHGNSAKLKEQFSTYQENLSKIDIPEDFKVKHYYTFQDLDRLDKERKSQLQNSYSRDYRWINTTLESLTDGIQRLNSDLVKHLNQNAYTNNNNVQILVDSEQNIRKNLEIVQEDLRRREEAKGLNATCLNQDQAAKAQL
ncbi:hypothetical protein N1495_08955 [Streptococcus didelphis]|uniref:Uncharacterized protein n=1 Tax=Streptococcus didelphis TaxID=102886 RepID=A0ABY9LKR4_9STRE|nr:hypothetical protein [Streptococcus didelphis]WMB28755.1 hypothetical protein N1496_04710 [Streptococcus didelphis]WMB29416.1 hypothetical protein N1495_08955 [Streptococcus didelphis]